MVQMWDISDHWQVWHYIDHLANHGTQLLHSHLSLQWPHTRPLYYIEEQWHQLKVNFHSQHMDRRTDKGQLSSSVALSGVESSVVELEVDWVNMKVM